jgi:hypothetical protein
MAGSERTNVGNLSDGNLRLNRLRASATSRVFGALGLPGGLVLGLVIAGHLGAGQKLANNLEAKSVVAEKYEVLGRNGTPAAMLYRTDAGQARLVFFGEKGELRLSIGINPDGSPGIVFLGADGKARLYMGFSPREGTPQLSLFDDQGNQTISLDATKQNGPAISMGRMDKGRITLGLSKEGEPSILLWSKNNEPRLGLDLVDGAPVIEFIDGNKGVRARWRLLADGSPDFTVLDSQSRERLSIGTDKTEHPFIRMTDPDKNAVKNIR